MVHTVPSRQRSRPLLPVLNVAVLMSAYLVSRSLGRTTLVLFCIALVLLTVGWFVVRWRGATRS
jgi:hypothetical protein